jgi:hypothetical protein
MESKEQFLATGDKFGPAARETKGQSVERDQDVWGESGRKSRM